MIGVIADTHGLVRPQARERLRGVDRIVHAGDVGGPEVLTTLETLAPVTAVRGNNDTGEWARVLPETAVVAIGGVRLYVLHDVKELALTARAGSIAAVIAGHSHRPSLAERDGVLFMNPGSIGPRRFKLPVAMGFLVIRGTSVRGEIVYLDV